jgi:Tol biopolymer transport system component
MKRGLSVGAAAGLAALLAAPLFAQAQAPKIRLVTSEFPLGRKHPGVDHDAVTVSPDSRRVAYVARRGGKQFVVVDGVEGKEYGGIGERTLLFSPDSRRVAYVARRGGKQFVVVDGVEGKEYDSAGTAVFSPDGTRVAYDARQGGKAFVVVDGVEGKEYESLRNGTNLFGPFAYLQQYVENPIGETVGFSPDSRRVAYVAQSGGKEFLVVDGVEGKEQQVIPAFVFSPDSRRVAYVATRRGKQSVVVDGVEGPAYDGIAQGTLRFSPDSRRVAYVARQGGKQFVVVDEMKGKEYDFLGAPVFSPDSTRVAYDGYRAGRMFVVVDGLEGKEYDSRYVWHRILFSPDSRRVAYVARQGGKQFVVVDEMKGKEYDSLGAPVFSPDSTRLAYLVQRSAKAFVVVDGVEGNEYRGFREALSVLSWTGGIDLEEFRYMKKHYGLRSAPLRNFQQDLEYPRRRSVAFSPDSRRVAYVAARGDKRFIVVDGAEGKEYDDFLLGSTLIFDSPTAVHALARRGDDLFRVDVNVIEE